MQPAIATYPQTCNVLTPTQRQQLLRTTQKLGKLLGSTPQLVDYNYTVHVDFPTKNRLTRHSSRKSSHSRPSLSSSSFDDYPPISPTASISTDSASTPSQYPISANESYPKQHSKSNNHRYPPVLRLAVNAPAHALPFQNPARPSPDTTPGSPPGSCSFPLPSATSSSSCSSTGHHLTSSPLSRSYTISVPCSRHDSSFVHAENEPQFRVKSEASWRRQKMDRVRKRLGECVPTEAVFPEEDDDDENVEPDDRSKFVAKSSYINSVYGCQGERGEGTLVSGLECTPQRYPRSLVSKSWGRRVLSIRKPGL